MPNFILVKDIHDVITHAKFGDDRLRGLGVVAGQISAFPINFAGRPYNTLTLPCERVTRRCISQNFANCHKQCRNKLYNESRTNQSNNKVMKLEGYSRPTCNKLCASSHVAFDRHRCNPQARPSMRFVDHTIDLPRWNFLSLDFWEEFQSEVPLFLEAPEFP